MRSAVLRSAIGWVFGLLIVTNAAMAASVFDGVSDSAWHPILVNRNGASVFYWDLLEPSAGKPTDIVGGILPTGTPPTTANTGFAAGYWYANSNYVMFRMRINEPITQQTATAVWQVALDTDAAGTAGYGAPDWVLQWDNKTDSRLEAHPGVDTTVLSGGAGGNEPAVQNVVGTATTTWSYSNTKDAKGNFTNDNTYVRQNVAVYDGSNFGGDPDYFIDIAMPRYTFGNALDSARIALATSEDHNNINKDVPDVPWSQTTNITPEPRAWAVILGGLMMACLWYRRPRRKSTTPDA